MKKRRGTPETAIHVCGVIGCVGRILYVLSSIPCIWLYWPLLDDNKTSIPTSLEASFLGYSSSNGFLTLPDLHPPSSGGSNNRQK